ncbi:MAG: hypothetical protein M1405_00495 [Patescibacteria group bacterium]|nr:hypothetical protein [Patescibacteria group bacterium]
MGKEGPPNGYLPQPASQRDPEAEERTFDTGPEGLGIPSLKPKEPGNSRRQHPERRDRGHRSPQYYSRGIR